MPDEEQPQQKQDNPDEKPVIRNRPFFKENKPTIRTTRIQKMSEDKKLDNK